MWTLAHDVKDCFLVGRIGLSDGPGRWAGFRQEQGACAPPGESARADGRSPCQAGNETLGRLPPRAAILRVRAQADRRRWLPVSRLAPLAAASTAATSFRPSRRRRQSSRGASRFASTRCRSVGDTTGQRSIRSATVSDSGAGWPPPRSARRAVPMSAQRAEQATPAGTARPAAPCRRPPSVARPGQGWSDSR